MQSLAYDPRNTFQVFRYKPNILQFDSYTRRHRCLILYVFTIVFPVQMFARLVAVKLLTSLSEITMIKTIINLITL